MTLFSFGPEGWGDELAKGMAMTLIIAILGFVLGLLFGIVGAVAKLRSALVPKLLAEAYTLIVRGVPELLVIYFLFYGGSGVFDHVNDLFGYGGPVALDALAAGVVSIGLISGAYSSEIMRGAMLSIPRGQFEAAAALSMSRWLTFRHVTWPQLLRHAILPLGNEWLLTLKGTSLISVIGVVELMRATGVAAGSTRMPFTFYFAAFFLYLALNAVSSFVFSRIERRIARGMDAP